MYSIHGEFGKTIHVASIVETYCELGFEVIFCNTYLGEIVCMLIVSWNIGFFSVSNHYRSNIAFYYTVILSIEASSLGLWDNIRNFSIDHMGHIN